MASGVAARVAGYQKPLCPLLRREGEGHGAAVEGSCSFTEKTPPAWQQSPHTSSGHSQGGTSMVRTPGKGVRAVSITASHINWAPPPPTGPAPEAGQGSPTVGGSKATQSA